MVSEFPQEATQLPASLFCEVPLPVPTGHSLAVDWYSPRTGHLSLCGHGWGHWKLTASQEA